MYGNLSRIQNFALYRRVIILLAWQETVANVWKRCDTDIQDIVCFHNNILKSWNSAYYYSGITLFNSLPSGIKNVAHNINKFKHELKKFLTKNLFYSVKEYTGRDATYDIGVSQ
jgi:hypothetical protein